MDFIRKYVHPPIRQVTHTDTPKDFPPGSLLDPTGRPVSPIDVRDFDTLDPISDYIETQPGSILDLPLFFDDKDAQWDVNHQSPTHMTGDQPQPDDDCVVRVSTR